MSANLFLSTNLSLSHKVKRLRGEHILIEPYLLEISRPLKHSILYGSVSSRCDSSRSVGVVLNVARSIAIVLNNKD